MSKANVLIPSRFRGALLGVLVGDCCGAPYEGKLVHASTLAEQLEDIIKSDQATLKFTDDTAMTKATCISLIQNKRFDPRHMAKEYTETYYKEPRRGYGAAVQQVFRQLHDSTYDDPFGPASRQFNGSGSFGNGAAMRCNGIALFAHKHKLNDRQTMRLVEDCSKITHSHPYGIYGAMLLVRAIKYVLALDEDTLNEIEFIDDLIKSMHDIENSKDKMFTEKLKSIKKILDQLSISGNDTDPNEVVSILGNDVSAQNSVPLAIYSFLKGISKFTDAYRIENEFIRTLHWAISCGGDTDTIASMACGLSGAYLGVGKIPEQLYKKCENWQEVISLADQIASM